MREPCDQIRQDKSRGPDRPQRVVGVEVFCGPPTMRRLTPSLSATSRRPASAGATSGSGALAGSGRTVTASNRAGERRVRARSNPCSSCRIQAKIRLALIPCLRATAATDPAERASAMIRSFSSSERCCREATRRPRESTRGITVDVSIYTSSGHVHSSAEASSTRQYPLGNAALPTRLHCIEGTGGRRKLSSRRDLRRVAEIVRQGGTL